MISLREEAVALTLTNASSRATDSLLVMSTILTTSITLSSCFRACSTLASSPSTIMVIRDRCGCSVCPTAMLSMLKLRRRKRFDTRLSTPGLSSTNATNVCFVLDNDLVLLSFYSKLIYLNETLFLGLAFPEPQPMLLPAVLWEKHTPQAQRQNLSRTGPYGPSLSLLPIPPVSYPLLSLPVIRKLQLS